MDALLFGIGKITVVRLIDNLMIKRSLSLLKLPFLKLWECFRVSRGGTRCTSGKAIYETAK